MNTALTTESPRKVHPRSLFYARKADGTPFTFKHQGRTFRLFKRIDSEDAPYYTTWQLAGRRHSPSLLTNQRETAVQTARIKYDTALRDSVLRAAGVAVPATHAPLPAKSATLGALFDAYERAALAAGIRPISIGVAAEALRLVVRQAQGQPIRRWQSRAEYRDASAAVDAQSTRVLDGALIKTFQAARLATVRHLPAIDQGSAVQSLHSYVRSARSLFTPDLMLQYQRAGLHLPDLKEFLSEPILRLKRRERARPDRALLQKTFEAAEQLRDTDPNAYAVFLLARRSLRRGDIAAARRDWLQHLDAEDDADWTAPVRRQWFLVWPVAKTSRWHRVAIDDTEAAWLMAHWEREQPGRQDWERDYLITAGDQTNEGARLRAACVFKRVNAWMRTLGWTTGHTIHELRALYARLKQAQVGAAAMAGLKAAAGDLGHSGTAVTEQHYTGGNSLERNNVVQFPGRKVA